MKLQRKTMRKEFLLQASVLVQIKRVVRTSFDDSFTQIDPYECHLLQSDTLSGADDHKIVIK